MKKFLRIMAGILGVLNLIQAVVTYKHSEMSGVHAALCFLLIHYAQGSDEAPNA